MSFLRRLFGGKAEEPAEYGDPQGIYLYAQCDRCGAVVKVRADKQHDLNPESGGYVWHKTIVDSKCFQRMTTVVHFDRSYSVRDAELEGGRYITREAYEAALEAERIARERPTMAANKEEE